MCEWLLKQGGDFVRVVGDNLGTLTVDFLLTALVLYPLCNFLRYGWAHKAEEIKASMSSKGKQTYFKLFFNR